MHNTKCKPGLFPWLWLLVLPLACVALLAAGCAESPIPSEHPFICVGKIVNVEPVSVQNSAMRWTIEAEVVRVLHSEEGAPPKKGAHIVFLVNSVVETFMASPNSVRGKTFVIAYKSSFQNPYPGGVDVTEQP